MKLHNCLCIRLITSVIYLQLNKNKMIIPWAIFLGFLNTRTLSGSVAVICKRKCSVYDGLIIVNLFCVVNGLTEQPKMIYIRFIVNLSSL